MAAPMVPIDIQAQLDHWLASNPAAQKYVTKLWYVPAGLEPPPDVTHMIELRSQLSAERSISIGLVVVPEFAIILDGLLGLIATQPPPR